MSAAIPIIQRFLRASSGFAIDDDKGYLIEDRLQPIMRDAGIMSLDELARYLHANSRSGLARLVAETLTINETSFFRDKTPFRAFGEKLLPTLLARRQDKRRLRIWCVGCSTGQEPYSLAMILDEKARSLIGWQVEIVATDLSNAVIERARAGLYSQFEVQRGLPVAMLLRHFHRENEGWRISDAMRAKVDFKPRNLMAGFRDMGSFDLIFCRNVMIYFDVETKKRVLVNLSATLAEDGYLMLGATENVSGLNDGLRAVSGHNFLFFKDITPGADDRLNRTCAAST